MRRRTLAKVPVLFTVAALLIGACGGDDDAGGSEEGALVSGCREPLAPAAAEQNPAGLDGLEACEPDSRDHTEDPVAYTESPPVGGAHFPRWRTCGFYGEEVPAEEAVHSLEHGAVWVTYRNNLEGAEQDVLRQLADEHDFVLVSAYPDQTDPVVASAWGLQLRLESARDPRLAKFVETYEQGPQTPEPGAPCTGGRS